MTDAMKGLVLLRMLGVVYDVNHLDQPRGYGKVKGSLYDITHLCPIRQYTMEETRAYSDDDQAIVTNASRPISG